MLEHPAGTFHLYASAFSEACGLNAWTTNSEVIHAVGTSAVGPFVFRDVALPVYHHNAQPAVAPDGTFLIFAIGMDPQGGIANCSASEQRVPAFVSVLAACYFISSRDSHWPQ